MTTDTELRSLFAPLDELEPTADQIAALSGRVERGRARRRRRRIPLAVAATTAVAAAGFALLPASDAPDERPDTLRLAAAVAAERATPPPDVAPFRYTRVRATFTYAAREGNRIARDVNERTSETWVGARWTGREIAPAGRHWQTGDPELARREFPRSQHLDPLTKPIDRAFAYGDGALAELDPATLPSGRDEIARVLTEGIRTDRWSPYPESRGRPTNVPEEAQRAITAYSMVLLLVYARLNGDQRAALLDVLADSADARDLGTVTDAAGREGRGVDLVFPQPGWTVERIRIVFDPGTAEVREWTLHPIGGASKGSPERHELVLATGWADAIGDRP
jgi:hypothetical protein